MSDQDKDPVVHSSLSKPLFISSALLVLSMAWGLYDEMYGIRPWKGYQARFVKVYSQLSEAAPARRGATSRSRSRRRPNTSSSMRDMQAAEKAAMPRGVGDRSTRSTRTWCRKILALNDPFQEVRSHIGALTYQIEVTQQREQQGFAAQADRGAEGREATKLSAARRDREAHAWTSTDDGQAAAGLEGREGASCCSSAST